MLDALLASHALRVQEPAPDADAVRAEAQRLDDLGAARDAAVDEDVKLALLLARRVGRRQALGVRQRLLAEARRRAELGPQQLGRVPPDLEQDVQRRARRVQLPAAVVRDDDAVAAGAVRQERVLDGLDA